MEKVKAVTPEDLNAFLAESDSLLADRGVWQKNLLELLNLRDRMEKVAQELEKAGAEITPQRNAMRTMDGVLRQRRTTIARELASARLSQARAEKKPPREHWWWYSDVLLYQERRRTLLRWGRMALVVLGLLTAALFTCQKISEKSAAVYSHLREAEKYYRLGEYSQALAEVQAAMLILPDESSPYIWQSVIYEGMGGHQAESQESMARAAELYGSETDVYLERGVIYYRLEDLAASRRDADIALQLDPESGPAYLLLANILFDEGKVVEAEAAVQNALTYAEGDAGTEVMAKMLLARILEQGGANFPISTPTPTGKS